MSFSHLDKLGGPKTRFWGSRPSSVRSAVSLFRAESGGGGFSWESPWNCAPISSMELFSISSNPVTFSLPRPQTLDQSGHLLIIITHHPSSSWSSSLNHPLASLDQSGLLFLSQSSFWTVSPTTSTLVIFSGWSCYFQWMVLLEGSYPLPDTCFVHGWCAWHHAGSGTQWGAPGFPLSG